MLFWLILIKRESWGFTLTILIKRKLQGFTLIILVGRDLSSLPFETGYQRDCSYTLTGLTCLLWAYKNGDPFHYSLNLVYDSWALTCRPCLREVSLVFIILMIDQCFESLVLFHWCFSFDHSAALLDLISKPQGLLSSLVINLCKEDALQRVEEQCFQPGYPLGHLRFQPWWRVLQSTFFTAPVFGCVFQPGQHLVHLHFLCGGGGDMLGCGVHQLYLDWGALFGCVFQPRTAVYHLCFCRGAARVGGSSSSSGSALLAAFQPWSTLIWLRVFWDISLALHFHIRWHSDGVFEANHFFIGILSTFLVLTCV